MIPDDQMIIIVRDSMKRQSFTARLPRKDVNEQSRIKAAQHIVDHFKEPPKFDYDPMIHSPGDALIVLHDKLRKPEYGIVTRSMGNPPPHKSYTFIGYAGRNNRSGGTLALYIIPWKFFDLFVKSVEPFFPETNFDIVKKQLETEYDIRQLPESDAAAIMNL